MTRQTPRPRPRRKAPPVAHADLYSFDPADVTDLLVCEARDAGLIQ